MFKAIHTRKNASSFIDLYTEGGAKKQKHKIRSLISAKRIYDSPSEKSSTGIDLQDYLEYTSSTSAIHREGGELEASNNSNLRSSFSGEYKMSRISSFIHNLDNHRGDEMQTTILNDSRYRSCSRESQLSNLKEQAIEVEKTMKRNKSVNLKTKMTEIRIQVQKKNTLFQMRIKAALLIQKVFRGYYVRKNIVKIVSGAMNANRIDRDNHKLDKKEQELNAVGKISSFFKERLLIKRERQKHDVKKLVLNAILIIQKNFERSGKFG